MRLTLVIQREPGTDDSSWVIAAVDEFVLDEWNGRLPDAVQAKLDADPANVRLLDVVIPDGSYERAWRTPTVTGEVQP